MKKTKGIVVLFLSLVLVLTTIVGFGFETMPVFADDETPEFEIEDNVLVKYNGTAAEVTVPDGVTAIGGNAFSYKENLLKVTLPESCTSIGDYSFAYCSKLVDINLDKVTAIGRYAFSGCGFKSVTIPGTVKNVSEGAYAACFYISSVTVSEGVESLGNNCFRDCYSVKEVSLSSTLSVLGTYCFSSTAIQSITLPEGITEIPAMCFNNCGSLTTINMPSTLKAIGQSAFVQCWSLTGVTLPEGIETLGELCFQSTGLQSIHLPASVKDIREWVHYTDDNGTEYIFNSHAFFNLSSLKEITVDSENENYTVYNGALYSKDYSRLIIFPSASEQTKFEAHEKTELIMERAFQYDWKIKEVVLNEGLEEISHYAFSGCGSLETVNIPSTVKSLGGGAFMGCSKVKEFVLPDTLEVIGGELVNDGTFENCESAESINIPKNIKSIYGGVFRGCKSLKSLWIPKTVTALPDGFIDGCDSLETIEVEEGNPTLISDNGALYSEGGKTLVIYPFGIKSLHYEVKEGTENIAKAAFKGNTSIVVITLPSSIKSIGASAFEGCTNLATVDLSKTTITTIPSSAFQNSGIRFIDLPETVTTIEGYAFYGAMSLETIDLKNVTTIGWFAFNTSGLTSLYIPDTVTMVENGIAQQCPNLVSIRFSAGMNSIPSAPVYGCTNLSEIIIPEGVEVINGYTFSSLPALTSLALPKTVNSIDTGMINTCVNLATITIDPENEYYVVKDGILYDKAMTTIVLIPAALELDTLVIPDTVTTLPDDTLQGLKVKNIVIPEGITSLPYGGFRGSSVETITLPSTITSLPYGAFQNCANLREVNLEYVVSYQGSVFNGCKSLTEIKLNSKADINGAFSLFADCTGLTEFIFPEGTTTIPQYMFENCVNLAKITIPETVTNIETHAFDGCTSLEAIIIPASVISTESSLFVNCTNLKDVVFFGNAPIFGSDFFAPDGDWFKGIANDATLYVNDAEQFAAISGYFANVKSISSENMPVFTVSVTENNGSVIVEVGEAFYAQQYVVKADGTEIQAEDGYYVIQGVLSGTTVNIEVTASGTFGNAVLTKTVKTSYTVKEAGIEELKAKIEEAEKLLEEANADKEAVSKELEEIKAQLETLKAEKSQLETDKSELNAMIETLNAKIAQLQKDLANANSCSGEVVSAFGILALCALVPVLFVRKKKED